jgi:hypothetical protein
MAITDRLRLWIFAYSGGTVPELHRSSLWSAPKSFEPPITSARIWWGEINRDGSLRQGPNVSVAGRRGGWGGAESGSQVQFR